MKDDHIYTLNHNINKLNQRLANNNTDNNSDEPSVEDDYIEDIVIKPSSNYRVDEDRDPNY